jgi:hypothetical protein
LRNPTQRQIHRHLHTYTHREGEGEKQKRELNQKSNMCLEDKTVRAVGRWIDRKSDAFVNNIICLTAKEDK